MSKPKKDEKREYRIDMEVVVDAYDSDERAMGWYYYVSDECSFPFKAKCVKERRISPLKINAEVEVVATAPMEECEKELFVDINWEDRVLAVPLSQLTGIGIDNETQEIIEDWHYWFERGYKF